MDGPALTPIRDGHLGAPMLERAHDEVERLLREWVCPVPHGIREELGRLLGADSE